MPRHRQPRPRGLYAGGETTPECNEGVASADPDELAYRITNVAEYPVVQYVRELPFESAVYPANMYHGFGDTADVQRKGLISWSAPGHDLARLLSRGCGFIREKGSMGDGGICFTACSDDPEHYVGGRRSHCWSLHCPRCMNDTALRMGSCVEERLGSYRVLMEKQGRDPGPLGHWVISPPQEYAKLRMQTVDGYDSLRRGIEKSLCDCGSKAGVLVFHPWRQQTDRWELSPHFHSILFGFIDTDLFRKEHPGWVIKKVHADEEIESVCHTAEYLMTHAGLGIVERDVFEIDYDYRFLCYMLPGLGDDGDSRDGSMFRFTDEDVSDRLSGRGRMVGDVSGVDWLSFVMEPLSYALRMTYFGSASNKSISTVAVEKEYRTRVCRDCGKPLGVFRGVCDHLGEPSRFLFENTIRSFREDRDLVKGAMEELRGRSENGRVNLSELSPKVAKVVSRDEIAPGGRAGQRVNTGRKCMLYSQRVPLSMGVQDDSDMIGWPASDYSEAGMVLPLL